MNNDVYVFVKGMGTQVWLVENNTQDNSHVNCVTLLKDIDKIARTTFRREELIFITLGDE